MLALMVLIGYAVAPSSLIIRRLLRGWSGWLLALFPIALFVLFALQIGDVSGGSPLTERYPWVDDLGLQLSFTLDSLGLLFALLITLTTACVVSFTGTTLPNNRDDGLLFCLLLVSMSSMLGLVLAGNMLTLLIFWMVTAMSSCSLLGYKTEQPAMWQHTSRAITITIGGALLLLTGLVLLAEVTATPNRAGVIEYAFETVFANIDTIGRGPTTATALLFIVAGCATATALFPFHLWFANAVDVPTPARASLHSVGLGLAGIYLLARFGPMLNNATISQDTLGLLGGVTLLLGAIATLHQQDVRAGVIYSSLSHAGLLAMLAGAGGAEAHAALVISVVVHALATAALFLLMQRVVALAGTSNMDQMGGLRQVLPVTMVLVIIAAVSLTGAPVLIGFAARRIAFAGLLSSSLPAAVRYSMLIVAVLGSAIAIAAMVRLVKYVFFGTYRVATTHKPRKSAIAMLIAPVLLIMPLLFISLPVVGLASVSNLLTAAVAATEGESVTLALTLWSGGVVPMVALAVAIGLGIAIALLEAQIVPVVTRVASRLRVDTVYHAITRFVVNTSTGLTATLQRGKLPTYIATTLMLWPGLIGPMFVLVGLDQMGLPAPDILLADLFSYELIFMLPIPFGVVAAVLARSPLDATIAVSAVGTSVLILLVLFSAPDVAILMILLHVVVLALIAPVFAQAPAQQHKRSPSGIHVRDGAIALTGGVLMALLTLVVATSRAFLPVSSFYVEQSVPRAGTENIVNALMTNFRGFDTMGLLILLFLALLAAYGLSGRSTFDIPDLSQRTVMYDSLIFRTMATIMFPLLMVIALALVMRGYAAPGGGFAGGLLAAAAIIIQAMAFNPRERRRLFRFNYLMVAVAGIWIAVGCGMMSLSVGLPFLTALWQEIPVVGRISTPLLFDTSIALLVCGVTVQVALLLLQEMKKT